MLSNGAAPVGPLGCVCMNGYHGVTSTANWFPLSAMQTHDSSLVLHMACSGILNPAPRARIPLPGRYKSGRAAENAGSWCFVTYWPVVGTFILVQWVGTTVGVGFFFSTTQERISLKYCCYGSPIPDLFVCKSIVSNVLQWLKGTVIQCICLCVCNHYSAVWLVSLGGNNQWPYVCVCVFFDWTLVFVHRSVLSATWNEKKKNKRQRKTQSSQTTTNGRDMMWSVLIEFGSKLRRHFGAGRSQKICCVRW